MTLLTAQVDGRLREALRDPASSISDIEALLSVIEGGRKQRLSAVQEATEALSPSAEADLRCCDDLRRRRVFQLLLALQPDSQRIPKDLLRRVDGLLDEGWRRAYRRAAEDAPRRLVVVPTWQCELRCRYCLIPKQDGRVMSERVLERGLGLLMSADWPEVQIQFFGGEPLLEWPLVQRTILGAEQAAAEAGKQVSFLLTTNGLALDEARREWLAEHPVRFEVSLDGAASDHDEVRKLRRTGAGTHAAIAANAAALAEQGLPVDVTMVVHPRLAHRVDVNFLDIVDQGLGRVFITPGQGMVWERSQMEALARSLHRLAESLQDRPDAHITNLDSPFHPLRHNSEITLDWDGVLYGGNGFLHETRLKERFVLGHLDELGGFDRYWFDRPTNEELLAWTYDEATTANNLAVGRILVSFLRWLHSARSAVSP